MAELVDEHLSGLGVSLCLCVCAHPTTGGVSVGKRDVLNERAAGEHTHTHAKHPPSVLLSLLISLLSAFCLCLFGTGLLNRSLCKTPHRPLLAHFCLTAGFLGEIKATPGRFTAFTAVFYSAVFLPSGRCQVTGGRKLQHGTFGDS